MIGSAQRNRSDLVASGDLGLEPFDLDDVAELAVARLAKFSKAMALPSR